MNFKGFLEATVNINRKGLPNPLQSSEGVEESNIFWHYFSQFRLIAEQLENSNLLLFLINCAEKATIAFGDSSWIESVNTFKKDLLDRNIKSFRFVLGELPAYAPKRSVYYCLLALKRVINQYSMKKTINNNQIFHSITWAAMAFNAAGQSPEELYRDGVQILAHQRSDRLEVNGKIVNDFCKNQKISLDEFKILLDYLSEKDIDFVEKSDKWRIPSLDLEANSYDILVNMAYNSTVNYNLIKRLICKS